MIDTKLEKGIPLRFGSDWPGQRCDAKTRKGTACQKPPIKGKRRCRLHGGLSSGPKSAEGKSRIAETHYRHGRRSKKFVKMKAKIWKELREIEARMRMDGLI